MIQIIYTFLEFIKVMKNSIIYIFSFILFAFFQIGVVNSISGQNKTAFIRTSPNTYTPSLYSDKINIQVMLVNLPGVKFSGSTFQGTFKTYFIPEGEIEKLAQSKGGSIDKLNSGDISNKTLLISGSFNKNSLDKDRIYQKLEIPFKQKVPDKLRTMLGKIVTFYSIKIYDAKLKKSIYKDDSFTYFPFERDDTNKPRKIFHLSFYVNDRGSLYTSSLPRNTSDTNW